VSWSFLTYRKPRGAPIADRFYLPRRADEATSVFTCRSEKPNLSARA
jgi:hypothetical protein